MVDYIKKCGISVTIIFFIFLTLSIVGLAASSFWLSVWSNDSLDFKKSQELKEYRLSVYLALGVLQCKILKINEFPIQFYNKFYCKGILLTIANYFQVIMFIKGATYLHNKLLNSILRSTMHFFESTPIGRIINRFSKDVEATESYIPDSFKICVFCLSNILNTLIIVTYSTPYVLVFLVPIFIVYTFVQVNNKSSIFFYLKNFYI